MNSSRKRDFYEHWTKGFARSSASLARRSRVSSFIGKARQYGANIAKQVGFKQTKRKSTVKKVVIGAVVMGAAATGFYVGRCSQSEGNTHSPT